MATNRRNDEHSADMTEMLFENREKRYGAYVLRKHYHWHLMTALAVVVHFNLLLVSWPTISDYLFAEEKETVANNVLPSPHADADTKAFFKSIASQSRCEMKQRTTCHSTKLQPMNLEEVQSEMRKSMSLKHLASNGNARVKVWIDNEGNYVNHKILSCSHLLFVGPIQEHIKDLKFNEASIRSLSRENTAVVSLSFH